MGVAGPGRGVAFVFSGNGAQWVGMAAAEMRGSRPFREAIARADAALLPHLGWSVAAALRGGMPAEALAATEVAQPLLFAIQYGIVAALAAEGITPAICLGHSVGEVAAAQAAGLLSLAQAARLIVARSRAQAVTRGQGRMAALGTTVAEAEALIAACHRPGEAPLEIAALNAPGSLTVAGPEAALARLGEAAEARRLTWIPLDLDYAFHSAAMDPVRDALLQGLRGLRAGEGRVPMISSVTGGALAREACTPAYWWRNLREPVRFEAAVREAAATKPLLGVCIGMQMLLDRSEEGPTADGTPALGLIGGEVVRFRLEGRLQPDGSRFKVPQMGWNEVFQARPHPVWRGVPDGSHFYFVHSFYARPSDERHSAGVTDYGGRFTSALARDNIFATQFHPEKSAGHGLALYRNFLDWTP